MATAVKQPVFNYQSVFKYTKVVTDEKLFTDSSCPEGGGDDDDDFNDWPFGEDQNRPAGQSMINRLVHRLIIFVCYATLIVTFPVSAFFCLRRIHSLQRCLIYRLGIRLPIKGPGIIIKFPVIDSIEVIDLSDYEFTLVETTQPLMTSDGSIIEFATGGVQCRLTVCNAVRSSTQLKDSRNNVQQFCRLSFANMIASTHVEDFENKTDIIMRQFDQNCNLYLNNWGYNCKVDYLPKFSIINRANPVNPIVRKLKSMFGGGPDADGGDQQNPMMTELLRLQASAASKMGRFSGSAIGSGSGGGGDPSQEQQIIASLELMGNKYRSYVSYDINIAIVVELKIEYFVFTYTTGKVSKLSDKPNNVHINISADNNDNLMKFCINNDMNCVRISTNLM
ncbi:uncharacterized protein LOC128954052 [Oppia nitens]|uniref:uncharacterized protein LOC128954052 n=1 Tax=Oppia nitens TaxID=1686743 RepID=UPI0023DA16B5|nr:uncharacterized protein LOC128954052 [Oppia nitens]